MPYSASQIRTINQREKFATITRISNTRRRVMSLQDYATSVATDARKAVDDTMQRQYEDGLISVEQYEEHLRAMAQRTDVSETDRSKIFDRIRDVRREAQAQNLVTKYQSMPPGSPEQIQAAKELQGFYDNLATSTQPGTLANSKYAAEAAQWGQQAATIESKQQAAERKSFRLQKLAEVASLPATDPDTAVTKAQVYAELRNMALEDGEVDEANKYEASSQAEIQRAEVLNERMIEQQKADYKREVVGWMNQNLDLYQDGKLGPEGMLQALREVERTADEMGDSTLAIRVNSLRDSIERDIERNAKKGASSFKKQITNELDAIELDLSRLENAFKYGTEFEPTSEFFNGEGGQITLQDYVNLRALGYAAMGDIVDQAQNNGVELPESRVGKIEQNVQESNTKMNAYNGGRLVATVDPGSQELQLIDFDSPEEVRDYMEVDGLSYKLNRRNPETLEEMQQAISGGYASPKFFANTGTLTKAPEGRESSYQFIQDKKFWPDAKLDIDVPLYETNDDGVYAVRESDLREGGDPGKFIKVEATVDPKGTTVLKLKNESVSPVFNIDPVINVPNPQGGIQSIYVKKDPKTGQQQFYSQSEGRVLKPEEVGIALRGKQAIPSTVQGPLLPNQERIATEPEVAAPIPEAPKQEPTYSSDFVGPLPQGAKRQDTQQPTSYSDPNNFTVMSSRAAEAIGYKAPTLKQSEPKQNIPLLPDIKPSAVLKPQTTTEKVVSGALKAGAAVQSTLQKIPLIGKLFKM